MNITPIQNQTNYKKQSFGLRLIDINKLPCPVCKEEMLPASKASEILNAFTQKTEAGMKSKNAIKFFHKILPFLPNTEKQAVAIFENFAKGFPNYRFSEILQTPEIIEPFFMKRAQKGEAYLKKAAPIFEEMSSLLPDTLKEKFNLLNIGIQNRATGRFPNEIKRYKIEQEYAPLVTEIADAGNVERFRELTRQIPFEIFDENDLICKLSGKNDEAIMRSFLRNRKSVHVHLDDPTKTSQEKTICMCEKCCTQLSNIPFDDYFKIFPDFVKGVENQMKILWGLLRGSKYGISKSVLVKQAKFINENSPDAKIDIPVLKREAKAKFDPKKEKEKFLAREPKVAAILKKYEPKKEQFVRLGALAGHIRFLKSDPKSTQKEIERFEYIYKLLQEKYLSKEISN